MKFCTRCSKKLTRGEAKFCSQSCSLLDKRDQRFREGTATSSVLRNYLIATQGAVCSLCGWDKINPVTGKCPIELDHISGDSSDNSVENGRLLCPSCHSLQPTYKALNKGRGRHSRLMRYRNKESY